MAGDDFSELFDLARDLGKVPDNAGPNIRAAIQITSLRVKKDAQKSVSAGASSWRALPRTIEYETTVKGNGIESEIGYRKEGAGNLGNIREFGSPTVAPHNDLRNALEANEKDFMDGLDKALRDAEKKAGL